MDIEKKMCTPPTFHRSMVVVFTFLYNVSLPLVSPPSFFVLLGPVRDYFYVNKFSIILRKNTRLPQLTETKMYFKVIVLRLQGNSASDFLGLQHIL